ncbi:threonine/serine exporter family protein [Corynebacterium sp. sy017]|uniref:threonine/serine ThrE exporter family protein n=1 Tax=unclassified Corynebacterium TaxID=2624378 RepID=UPI001184C333|nr:MULTISPECIES: threonine/serine exporter family protein [unclassified Corynebacterium]MBP3088598.1 threonine/serine exporter family protein [Corynebacterium sp. sy017]QDZ42007.1 threonine/serine exporter family protein [Corynebacterium sp. sy039]TSD91892.1 threonine/serine exporter family protein [Corynebacterium sp. SY003]
MSLINNAPSKRPGFIGALRTLWRRGHDDKPSVATIDVAAEAPLSPIAPVDYSDPAQISEVLEIAARISEILIICGTTNSDAAAQARAITESYGLSDVHIDMTMKKIHLYAHFSNTEQYKPIVHVRVIEPEAENFDRLIQVDRLIRDIHAAKATPAQATKRLDDIVRTPPPQGILGVSTSWAIMCASVAMLIGGDALVAAISMFAGAIIVYTLAKLSEIGLPPFFQNTAGGIFASLIAAISYRYADAAGISIRPSMIIATSIVAMLAGLTIVQALQNGVSHSPITANAGFFNAAIATGGLVAGVGIGIALSNSIGFSLPPMETIAPPNFSSTSVRVAGSVIATAAYARVCHGDLPSIMLSGVTAFLGSSLYYFCLIPLGIDSISATAIMAVLIGFFGGLLGRRYRVPPLIITIAGITPLLPGLTIYRGMYALSHEQLIVGFSNLTLALVTATALSAGTVFGEWLARQVRA